jgi:curved DNA-binding protein
MEYKDYYKILGVSKEASREEIKKQYRKLAVKYHPDKNQGNKLAEDKFKELGEAYEVLHDPEKRKKYDTLGSDWKQYEQQAGGRQGNAGYSPWGQQGQGGRTSGTYSPDDFEGTDFSDFFNSFFGGGGRSRDTRRGYREEPVKGQDYEARMTVTLEEAYKGVKRMLAIGEEKISITVPPGIRDGQVLRVKGKGSKGRRGGESGHLYLHVEVQPDPHFERKEDDLHTDLHIPLYMAVLGGHVTLPTMTGSANIVIPPETQAGKTLRLKGMGMPVYRKKGESGALYVKIQVDIPQNLSREEIELFKKLSALRP